MSRITHFEIAAAEPEVLIKFYQQVFDWDIQKWGGPVDYWLANTGAQGTPGINGAIKHLTGANQRVINTVDVPSIDEAVEKVLAAGGKLAMEKLEIPGIGFHAYCEDPEGNLFGLFESK